MATSIEAAAAALEAEWAVTPAQVNELIETGEASPAHVRDLMLRLHAIAQERNEVGALLEAVTDRYRTRLERLLVEEQEVRASIEGYIVNINGGEKVRIPDVGTAYLGTVAAKPKVVDVDALVEHVTAGGLPVEYKPAPVDVTATLELLLDERDLRVTADGQLVAQATGEVVEVPGVEVEPERKTLRLRSVQ